MTGLPPCDPDLFKNGDVVGIYDAKHGAKAFESIIAQLRSQEGVPVDWNYAAGRAVVRCQPGHAAKFAGHLRRLGYVAA